MVQTDTVSIKSGKQTHRDIKPVSGLSPPERKLFKPRSTQIKMLTFNRALSNYHLRAFVCEKSIDYTSILCLQLDWTLLDTFSVIAFAGTNLIDTTTWFIVIDEVTRELGNSLTADLLSNSASFLNVVTLHY